MAYLGILKQVHSPFKSVEELRKAPGRDDLNGRMKERGRGMGVHGYFTEYWEVIGISCLRHSHTLIEYQTEV